VSLAHCLPDFVIISLESGGLPVDQMRSDEALAVSNRVRELRSNYLLSGQEALHSFFSRFLLRSWTNHPAQSGLPEAGRDPTIQLGD
jgi:hypothetical protein